MGSLSIWHWVIVLAIVTMVFGTKKLRSMGSDLGGAVKGFKDGLKESEEPSQSVSPVLAHGASIDVAAKDAVAQR